MNSTRPFGSSTAIRGVSVGQPTGTCFGFAILGLTPPNGPGIELPAAREPTGTDRRPPGVSPIPPGRPAAGAPPRAPGRRPVCSNALLGGRPPKRGHSVALGALVSGVEGVPPAVAGGDERIQRNHVACWIADFEFVEPYTEVEDAISGVLEDRYGMRETIVPGSPVEAETLAPLPKSLLMNVDVLPPVDGKATEGLHSGKQLIDGEWDDFRVRIVPTTVPERRSDSPHGTKKELHAAVLRYWAALGKRENAKRGPTDT